MQATKVLQMGDIYINKIVIYYYQSQSWTRLDTNINHYNQMVVLKCQNVYLLAIYHQLYEIIFPRPQIYGIKDCYDQNNVSPAIYKSVVIWDLRNYLNKIYSLKLTLFPKTYQLKFKIKICCCESVGILYRNCMFFWGCVNTRLSRCIIPNSIFIREQILQDSSLL